MKKKIWKIQETASDDRALIERFLKAGWEPFAVVNEVYSNREDETCSQTRIYFRRLE